MSVQDLLSIKNRLRISDIAKKLWSDFINNNSVAPWFFSAVGAGQSSNIAGTVKHPGILIHVSTASANSGGAVRTNNNSILLGGGEKTTFIFQPSSVLTGITRYIGFHNSSTISVPTQGAWINIVDGNLTGKTAKDSVVSTTGSSFTLASSTWYRAVIQLNSDGTSVTFTLYADDSNTVLWTDTLTTNIPIGTGRETGNADVCFYSVASAQTLGGLDYIDVILPNARRVV